jgi:hypothetical protein
MTERLNGEGKVFKGQQFITDIHYELLIVSRYKNTRTHTSEGKLLVGQDVRLRLIPSTAVSGHFGPDRLTLHMNDSRKQDFFVSTSDGDCTATGGPYQ